MNFNINKEWLLRHAEKDDKVEISAGRLDLEDLIAHKRALGASKETTEAPVPAFGKLINLCRRSKGLSMEQLAEKSPSRFIGINQYRTRLALSTRAAHGVPTFRCA